MFFFISFFYRTNSFYLAGPPDVPPVLMHIVTYMYIICYECATPFLPHRIILCILFLRRKGVHATCVYVAWRHIYPLYCRLLAAKSLLIWYLWRTFNGLACMSLQVNNSVKRIIARREQIFAMRVGCGMKIQYNVLCYGSPSRFRLIKINCEIWLFRRFLFRFFFCCCRRIASSAWRQQWDFDVEKSNFFAKYS